MDLRKLQLALLSRGIRLKDDDPLFIILELNEMLFDELASKHLQEFDRHTVAEIVTQVLTFHSPQQNQSRCVGGTSVEKTANRLEEVAATFDRLEGRMADVARVSAIESTRIVAGKVLTGISKEVGGALLKFENFGNQTAKISETATRMINASRVIDADATKTKRRAIWYPAIALLIFAVGAAFGKSLTSDTLFKVQTACAMQQKQ
jgi:hypothetical protein